MSETRSTYLRERFPAWSKRALAAHRAHETPCPACGSHDICLYLNYPGHYRCFICKHAWTDERAILPGLINNPRAA